MREVLPYRRSSSLRHEISITKATCYNKVYKSADLNIAAAMGKETLEILQRFNLDTNEIRYTPRPEERIPFIPPYYFILLNEDHDDYTADFVVITKDGRIAKVVTVSESPHEFIDCQMEYFRKPIV